VARRVDNPPNPWASAHVEWLGEPPAAQLQVYEERAASALAQNDSPDVPFRFSVNPYRGCQHACAYCYARPGHQHLGFGAGSDFDTRIVVKTNVAQCLERELGRRDLGSEWIAFSGVTDCYQPLEASYGLTRACLEACLRWRVSVGVVTKSALVRRDVDLLAELGRRAGARVFVSIPFLEREHARALEPWASEPAARFETLRRLSQAGIETGVAIAPLIPGLNDSAVAEVLERARDAGARHAFCVLLRLPAQVRPVFEARLRAALPLRAERVLLALERMRPAGSSAFGERMRGRGAHWETVWDLFRVTCRRLGLAHSEREAAPVEPLAPRRRAPGQLELF
jgi:DNA repair photolyase